MSLDQVRVDEVIVGERARRDYGDLTSLMDSIREHGILQPIGLAPGNHLLFGGRRLEAAKRLGMTVIDVTRPRTQTDALSLLKAERDENTCRKDMTPSELVALGMQIEEMERPAAEARKAEGQKAGAEARWGRDASGSTEPQASEPKPQRTADVVADALGTSGPSYKRMKHVFTTAHNEEETPEVREVAKEALADLDAGKASPRGAYERVREVRNGEDARKRPRATESVPTPPRPSKPGPRQKHRDVLERMTTALSGLVIAADEITELDSSVTQEEAAQLLGDLSRQIRSLNQIRNLLKERTK
ncbi:MAG TPA: ParB/RepB/Spo0J family partition protein [Jiangellaceae bacterium]|nr:ParB/RepB/Spo0J family partition protein [Jiangellaceae bacterium]